MAVRMIIVVVRKGEEISRVVFINIMIMVGMPTTTTIAAMTAS